MGRSSRRTLRRHIRCHVPADFAADRQLAHHRAPANGCLRTERPHCPSASALPSASPRVPFAARTRTGTRTSNQVRKQTATRTRAYIHTANGRTDGRTSERTDGRTDGRASERASERAQADDYCACGQHRAVAATGTSVTTRRETRRHGASRSEPPTGRSLAAVTTR